MMILRTPIMMAHYNNNIALMTATITTTIDHHYNHQKNNDDDISNVGGCGYRQQNVIMSLTRTIVDNERT